MTFTASPIRRTRLYEPVKQAIEDKIARGALKPGDQLPAERELMEAFGVGRTSVREALFALEQAGLVQLAGGERARVTRPGPGHLVRELSSPVRRLLSDATGMREFQAARRLFETALARDAARRAGAEEIEHMRAALEANRAAQGDLRAFEETDLAFHFAIARATRNALIAGLHEAMLEWLRGQRTASLKHKGAPGRAYEHHRAVFEAVAARDPDRAEAAMAAHLIEVERFYWAAEGAAEEGFR